ncbi:MAG TPA: OB-fold nucleic acid binding domain-containing protein, partial [Candidatus Sulfotelmatobacter sp.]|nr:OB-fold nucleic acid binding domain-containing protein [Candidatus Sulfotelmatobacter sp.]
MSIERTWCGTPRREDAGTPMTVYGWVDGRRDHGGLVFIDLRDVSGILQVVADADSARAAHAGLHGVRLEWVLRVIGTLRVRDPQNVNPKLATGEVELHAESCEV